MIGTVYPDIEQGSPEWFAIKMGLISSSNLSNVLSKGRGGKEAIMRRNYRTRLALERLNGITPSRFLIRETEEMNWGKETEDLARTEYELATGRSVTKIGGIKHAFLPVWSSTDGVDNPEAIKRITEIKCFNSANHYEALRTRHVPADYVAEVQGELWLGEAEVCDFVSFDPDFPPNAQLVVIEVQRNDKYIDDLMAEVAIFNDEVDAIVDYVKNFKETN
jgi:predicted phage-related endonuclease